MIFNVYARRSNRELFTVEADSEEEARRKVAAGDWLDIEQSEPIDTISIEPEHAEPAECETRYLVSAYINVPAKTADEALERGREVEEAVERLGLNAWITRLAADSEPERLEEDR